MNKTTTAVALLASAALLLAGCGSTTTETSAPAGTSTAGDKVFQIGAVTIVSHPALDAVYQGFVDRLAEKGYKDGDKVKLEFQNPQGDQATLTNIANNFASADKDLYVAIATPPSQALANVITKKPIVFAAVTDPVAAGLVKSWEAPGANITGTSDLNPVEDQLTLIKDIKPDTKTVGIVYSSSEVNSQVQVDMAKEAAGKLGIEIKTAPIVNSSEVQQAAASLDVDAYYVPTDNTVVSALESMVQVAEQKKRLLVTADIDSVKRGAAASVSIDYYEQGKQTADMALRILVDGADPASMPVETQKELKLVVNPGAAERMGSPLPDAVKSKAADTVS